MDFTILGNLLPGMTMQIISSEMVQTNRIEQFWRILVKLTGTEIFHRKRSH